jgi:multimeric flavodoxin WrbA
MPKALVINGSPRMKKGYTALLLTAFIAGMEDAGADVNLVYASKLKIKPCSCGQMMCWYETPGECCIKDNMQQFYPKLREAEHLVLATPVYIPLPGDMQNIINRLCPLVRPMLVLREGRTRAELRHNVAIQDFSLVATGGWWELANLDTVVRIVKELAEDASVPFGGAVLRPHANMMVAGDQLTDEGQEVMAAVKTAGFELIKEGIMRQETLDLISRPLIGERDYRQVLNQNLEEFPSQ